jgi:excisionase family DNA binding protein
MKPESDNQKQPRTLFEDPASRLLTSAEAGAFLGRSARTVQRLAKKRIIPAYHLNGDLRFYLADIMKALERYKTREVAL